MELQRGPPKSLAEYMNCGDYNGLMKNRGKGIRRWRIVENKGWTFQPDFVDKLNKKISKWIDRCTLLALNSSSFEGNLKECQSPPDPPQFIWVKGRRYRYAPEDDAGGQIEEEVPPMAPPVVVKIERIEEDVVDHRHGHQEQRSLTFMRDICVGTDDYWAPKVAPSVSTAPISSPRPQPQSQIPSLLGPGPLPYFQPVAVAPVAPQPQQSSSLLGPSAAPYVPPHLKQQPVAQSSASAYQSQVVDDGRVDKKEYEKVISGMVEQITGKSYQFRLERAKRWTPKTEEQRQALEQAKLDIFNVLVVGKGCALKYLIREFYRVTEENLDLSKIGVPDLRTLLVQMADMIYFRRERYTDNIFIFPNLANNQFEMVAHIGELVAEQRKDQNFRIPDENLLYECDITELFLYPEWRQQQQQQRPSVQSSYYGNYVNPNYNYNYYNNYYQNIYGRAGGGNPQLDYSQYLQQVTQQINHYSQQYYSRYGYHQGGNNYYRNN